MSPRTSWVATRGYGCYRLARTFFSSSIRSHLNAARRRSAAPTIARRSSAWTLEQSGIAGGRRARYLGNEASAGRTGLGALLFALRHRLPDAALHEVRLQGGDERQVAIGL